ncbi:hypothetical protein ACHAXR_011458 [Thalassiosira sp. AJA248-18]
MERKLSPPRAAWAPPTEAPNSLQSTQPAGRERLRSSYAETKQGSTGNDTRNNYLQKAREEIASSRRNVHHAPPKNNHAQEARRWVSHSNNSTPPSPGKRKRRLDHPLGVPSLASPPQQQHYHPQTKNNTNSRQPQINRSPPSTADSSDSDSTMLTAQKTALQCVDHASRRQAAAKAALSATSQISSSLTGLMGDSNRALTVARQSRLEAESAALRAEGAAKKVKEATDFVEKDKQRASLELDEANAQAEEAWEFFRRVKGTSPKGHRMKGRSPLKPKQEEPVKSVRIGTVVEVCEDSYCSSVANNSFSPLPCADVKKQKNERDGHVHWENNLPQPQMKMPPQLKASTSKRDSFIEPTKSFKGHTSPVTQIAAIDEKRFISSSWDTTIRMWDAETGECMRTFRGHRDWVHAVSVLDSKHFISGSDDRTVKLWNVDKNECIRTFEGHSSFVKALAPMEGDRFLSGSRDRTVKLFSVASGECLRTFEGHMDVVSAIVALGSNHFATGSHDNNIKYWNDSSKTCLRTLVGHTGSIKTLASVSDKEIVSGSDDKVIRLWNVTTGKCLREFGSKTSLVFSVTYICEGFFLSCGGNNIKLYHIPSGTCVKSYETPRISLAVVRLDDERFVTGSDQMLHLWKF